MRMRMSVFGALNLPCPGPLVVSFLMSTCASCDALPDILCGSDPFPDPGGYNPCSKQHTANALPCTGNLRSDCRTLLQCTNHCSTCTRAPTYMPMSMGSHMRLQIRTVHEAILTPFLLLCSVPTPGAGPEPYPLHADRSAQISSLCMRLVCERTCMRLCAMRARVLLLACTCSRARSCVDPWAVRAGEFVFVCCLHVQAYCVRRACRVQTKQLLHVMAPTRTTSFGSTASAALRTC
jgi:hypothetical protein